MKMRLAAAAATMCIASLSHPGAANAATLTYSHLSASAPDSFSLQLFDTNLGTLTGVQLGLSVTGDAIPEVVNPSYFFGPGTPASYSFASTTVDLGASGPGGDSTSVSLSYTAPAGTSAAAITPLPGPVTTVSNSTAVPIGNFGSYEAAGTAFGTFSALFGSITDSGSPSGLAYGGDYSAALTVSVTYTYDLAAVVTPVPAALPLFASGLAGFGYLVRRRRKQAAA